MARNSISETIAALSARPDATFSDVAHLASGVRGRTEVLEKGNMEDGMWWAGQSQGLIDAVLPCKTIISDIVSDAEAAIRRIAADLA